MKMSNKICEAEACENSRRNCNLSFFSFPENDPKRIGKWTANIKLKKSCRKNRVLCSDHFEIKAFADTLKRRLHRNAVPTIQNPVEDEPPKKFPCLEGFHCANDALEIRDETACSHFCTPTEPKKITFVC